MAAITWRTLNGASPMEALPAYAAAGNSFANMFGGLKESLKQFQDTDAANWQQTKLNNTNDYMDQLRSLDTPEKLAEAQKSGLLDTLRQGYGAQVDAQAVGAAQDARMGILQDRAVKAGVYQDTQAERAQRAVRDEFMTAVANKDFAKAQQIKDGGEYLNEGKWAQEIATGKDGKTVADRETTKFDAAVRDQAFKEKLQPGQLTLQDLSIKGARLNNQNSQATLNEKQRSNNLDRFITKVTQKYSEEQGGYTRNVSQIASKLGIPLNKAGTPDIDKMTTTQAMALQKEVSALGAPPSSSAYLEQTRRAILESGAPSANQLAALKNFEALNTGNGVNLAAADATKLKAYGEKLDARSEHIQKTNPYAINPKELDAQTASLMKAVTTKGDGDFFTNGPLKEEARKWVNGGFPTGKKDAQGKEIFVSVPPKIIEQVLAETKQEDTVLWNGSLRDAVPLIRELMTSPEHVKMRREADAWKLDPTNSVAKRTALEEITNTAGVGSSPTAFLSNLDERIKADVARSAEMPPVPAKPVVNEQALRDALSTRRTPLRGPTGTSDAKLADWLYDSKKKVTQ